MRTGTRIAFFTAPLFVLPAAGWYYTHLNIGQRMFVDRLGCGCAESLFNTNTLSLAVFAVLVTCAAVSWWIAARGLSRAWLWLKFVVFAVLSAVAYQRFVYYTWWL